LGVVKTIQVDLCPVRTHRCLRSGRSAWGVRNNLCNPYGSLITARSSLATPRSDGLNKLIGTRARIIPSLALDDSIHDVVVGPPAVPTVAQYTNKVSSHVRRLDNDDKTTVVSSFGSSRKYVPVVCHSIFARAQCK